MILKQEKEPVDRSCLLAHTQLHDRWKASNRHFAKRLSGFVMGQILLSSVVVMAGATLSCMFMYQVYRFVKVVVVCFLSFSLFTYFGMPAHDHCCAYEYKNRRNPCEGLSFHIFLKDKCQRAQWIPAVKRKNFEVTGNAVLCSRLFKPTDYYTSLRKKNRQHRITLSVVLSLRSTVTKYFCIPSRKRVIQGFP